MYLKLNSSKEREYLCSKEGFFLLLNLDPRAKFNQQCKYKCPTPILPRYPCSGHCLFCIDEIAALGYSLALAALEGVIGCVYVIICHNTSDFRYNYIHVFILTSNSSCYFWWVMIESDVQWICPSLHKYIFFPSTLTHVRSCKPWLVSHCLLLTKTTLHINFTFKILTKILKTGIFVPCSEQPWQRNQGIM